MRRNRIRSCTVDAENEEDFNSKCQMALLNGNSSKNNQIESGKKKQKLDGNENDKLENEYHSYLQDLDKISESISEDYLDDEDELAEHYHSKYNSSEEQKLDLVCNYLKKSIALHSIQLDDKIFYRYKNPVYVLSGNAIYDLNVKELVEDIIAEGEFNEKNEKVCNIPKDKSLKEFIIKNIKDDAVIKIMVTSNNDSIRKLYINSFLSNNKEEGEYDFEILKKKIKLFDKIISLNIFNTSSEFHKNDTSKIYYQLSNSFFILIDSTLYKAKEYLEKIFTKFEGYLNDKIIVIFGINMLFKQECTIDEFNLKEFAENNNYIYIPILLKDFTLNNSIIFKLLNLTLIKVINNNRKGKSRRSSQEINNQTNPNDNLNEKRNNITSPSIKDLMYDITKMKVSNNIGYKKNYRLNHINAFDFDQNNPFSKRKNRKWSGS